MDKRQWCILIHKLGKTKQPKEKEKNNIVQKNTMMNIYTNNGKKK